MLLFLAAIFLSVPCSHAPSIVPFLPLSLPAFRTLRQERKVDSSPCMWRQSVGARGSNSAIRWRADGCGWIWRWCPSRCFRFHPSACPRASSWYPKHCMERSRLWGETGFVHEALKCHQNTKGADEQSGENRERQRGGGMGE